MDQLALILAEMSAIARASDTEICGALIGDNDGVIEAVPLVNRSARARDAFFIPAEEVLRAEREAEARGARLVGFYHSHPRGDAVPSGSDLEQALPGYIYWIASSEGEVRAWRLREDRSGFDEVSITNRGDG
ncbi:MAG: Mov34/MPN/PAD-1 family protein [Gemmatimonadota bacterium]